MRVLGILLAIFTFVHPVSADTVVDLGRGPITIEEPLGYDPLLPTPVIVLLHGFGSSGPGIETYLEFRKRQDEYGFLYVTPNGTLAGGNRFWDATEACCNFTGTPVDDSGYLNALLDSIEAHYNVDPYRIYFTGHSNGGFMSYRMACDHADRVAAVASLAGASWDDPLDCAPSEPVSVLQIHGTADGTISYTGGVLNGANYPGAVETVEQWAAFNGCAVVPETSATMLNLSNTLPGMETTVIRYPAGCDQGREAELWSIAGGGHSPIVVGSYSRKVIEWLYAHAKPGAAVRVASGGGAAGESSAARPFGIVSASPTPFRSSTEILFRLDRTAGGSARVDVFDVRGRLVRGLTTAIGPGGDGSAVWNGRDGRGRPVPGGVYFVRLTGGGRSDTRKIVLSR